MTFLCKSGMKKIELRNLLAFLQLSLGIPINFQQILFVFPPACHFRAPPVPLFTLLISFSVWCSKGVQGAFRKHKIWVVGEQPAVQNARS